MRQEEKHVFLASLPSLALCFQPRSRSFSLTALAYLNTQKYGLFCSLSTQWKAKYHVGESFSNEAVIHIVFQ